MNQQFFKTLSRYRLIFVIFATLVLTAASMFVSSADITVRNQPASQGKAITPAGSLVLDVNTRQPAVGALPVGFVRSPDRTGRDGRGRYLVAVNSGFGLQFDAATNRAQQSLSIIDLNLRPAPAVIQNIYFPTPQSANVGAVFAPQPNGDGSFTLYVSGGVENKIWQFSLRVGAQTPITPPSPGPDTKVEAPFIDVSGFSKETPTPRYNNNRAPVYPTGLAISADGNTLFVANNLGDSLGIISDLNGARRLESIELSGMRERQAGGVKDFTYPYGVVALPANETSKVYVSCWNDSSIAVINFANNRSVSYIRVARHPTAMILDGTATKLYVVNSNADSVSVIDTQSDREIERINVRLAENTLPGNSPESLALSDDNGTLYVANAHSNSIAVVDLKDEEKRGSGVGGRGSTEEDLSPRPGPRPPAPDPSSDSSFTKVIGFIPTGQYPSAVAVANGTLFVGNGKGTGFENSSTVVNNSGRAPNVANERFPPGTGRGAGAGGQYSVSLISGNISAIVAPTDQALARYTQQVMRNNGLLGARKTKLFPGKSPIKHVIYVIKENRTYDQVFGDIERSGDGRRADGDPSLAIFGAGAAARLANGGAAQNISPNHRALALRFGLLDRFFVNSEASPDGHNWSTAAFSNDYVDKAYRWNYGGRGRTYDFEGFNRLPSHSPAKDVPPLFPSPVDAEDIAKHMRRYVPYLHGGRDVGEPETLYLWDAAARAGLTYRNYGEFVATVSVADVASVNANRTKPYPDISPNATAFPTKKSLEGHHSATFRNYDLKTPDSMTVDSYRAARESGGRIDPTISNANADERFRGNSRLGEWLEEFRGFVADRAAGRPDRMPSFSMLRLPNDHTAGLSPGMPTPQFFMAENDYAVGRIVEAVSNSPYWKDTAIFFVEDDAQDGPDHVDAHRSVALVVSAYNRPGALVHEFHNTVSLIRTMEILLGLQPMNQLDATAAPIDLFRGGADLRPFKALLPDVSLDNLMTQQPRDAAARYWMERTGEQNLTHADMADPGMLNRIIWHSVRGGDAPMPEVARLPAFDAMRIGINDEDEEEEEEERENEVAETRGVKSRTESK